MMALQALALAKMVNQDLLAILVDLVLMANAALLVNQVFQVFQALRLLQLLQLLVRFHPANQHRHQHRFQ